MINSQLIKEAVQLINNSKHTTVFTGAGISVESGIPPFRGPTGLWSKYDPVFLDITYFEQEPDKSWKLINEIFYDFMGTAKPNEAHKILALLENKGYIQTIITQNIDNLHQEAGSNNVLEFHGTTKTLTCIKCGEQFHYKKDLLEQLPPKCPKCKGLLKPDFVFFGEGIPEPANSLSFKEADIADIFIVIGTTGEIYPASLIPIIAKKNGTKIIEINTNKSKYTDGTTDLFLQGKATEIMSFIKKEMFR